MARLTKTDKDAPYNDKHERDVSEDVAVQQRRTMPYRFSEAGDSAYGNATTDQRQESRDSDRPRKANSSEELLKHDRVHHSTCTGVSTH